MKKVTIFMILLSISLPIILLLTSVEIATFDIDFFEEKYVEYNIMKVTGIEKDNLMEVTEELLSYLKGTRKDLIIFTEVNGKTEQVFEEREILHMEDVKELFQKGYLLRRILLFLSGISIIFIVIYQKKNLGKTLIISAIYPIILLIILATLMYVDFYKYFTYFHEIFFTNDLWLLNPKTDILIQMLPLEFFNSIAYKIVLLFIMGLLIILVTGILLSRKYKYCRH